MTNLAGSESWPNLGGPLRTPDEWLALKHPNLKVYDPDGWRGPNGRPWTDPISEGEFDRRLPVCTVGGAFGKDTLR